MSSSKGEDTMNENDILNKIKTYMEYRNWTLYKLAKEADIPYTSLHSMFEKKYAANPFNSQENM